MGRQSFFSTLCSKRGSPLLLAPKTSTISSAQLTVVGSSSYTAVTHRADLLAQLGMLGIVGAQVWDS